MIYEYKYIITVEMDADTEEEHKELRKKFKQELWRRYGPDPITRVTEIKRQ
jgi:hypothetical protein